MAREKPKDKKEFNNTNEDGGNFILKTDEYGNLFENPMKRRIMREIKWKEMQLKNTEIFSMSSKGWKISLAKSPSMSGLIFQAYAYRANGDLAVAVANVIGRKDSILSFVKWEGKHYFMINDGESYIVIVTEN